MASCQSNSSLFFRKSKLPNHIITHNDRFSERRCELRLVADYFVQMRKNGTYLPTKQEMIHAGETVGLLSAITGDKRFEKVMDLEEGEEEPKTVCEVLDRVENRGRREGRVVEYIALRSEDGYSAEDILQGLMERFHLTKKQAVEYMRSSRG